MKSNGRTRKVDQFDLNMKFIKTFESVKVASAFFNRSTVYKRKYLLEKEN